MFLFGLFLADIVVAKGPAKGEKPAENDSKTIDPYGRPKGFVQGKQRMYGIWYEDGAWRLRTTSGRRVKIGFHGIVEIDKDKIVPDYTALDRTKKRSDSDLVILSKNRQQMKFRFVTIGWTDGIDFKVGKRLKP